MGVVIGKRGQTLDAIEYLASIVLYPHPDARKRIELDAEGYKAPAQAASSESPTARPRRSRSAASRSSSSR